MNSKKALRCFRVARLELIQTVDTDKEAVGIPDQMLMF